MSLHESQTSLTEDRGVLKTVIREAQSDADAPSRDNYVCEVHYCGMLEDGSVFDNSKEDNVPFTVELGKGRVIRAWEVAVPTMKVGEVCRIVCTSDYGYGEQGSPPDIPPRATLIFEMELLSVRSMLRAAETVNVVAEDLNRLKLVREQRDAPPSADTSFATKREEALRKKEEAKAAAAARMANKGQKKGGKKGK